MRNVKLYVVDSADCDDDGFCISLARREPAVAPDFTVDMDDGEITNILISKRCAEATFGDMAPYNKRKRS